MVLGSWGVLGRLGVLGQGLGVSRAGFGGVGVPGGVGAGFGVSGGGFGVLGQVLGCLGEVLGCLGEVLGWWGRIWGCLGEVLGWLGEVLGWLGDVLGVSGGGFGGVWGRFWGVWGGFRVAGGGFGVLGEVWGCLGEVWGCLGEVLGWLGEVLGWLREVLGCLGEVLGWLGEVLGLWGRFWGVGGGFGVAGGCFGVAGGGFGVLGEVLGLWGMFWGAGGCFGVPGCHSEPCPQHLLREDELAQVRAGDGGDLLSDHLALAMGRLGERLALRRAGWLRAPGGFVATYAHGWVPPGPAVAMGTYGALVACGGPGGEPPSAELRELGRRVAQHVVGMAPTALGTPEDELGGDSEPRLLAQGTLLEPGVPLGRYLREHGGLQVWDFLRFQCGEQPPQDSPPA
uniref:Translation elongation factor EFTs/EF1B dimerisation domain-containing protein n=1 Tax=Taeniopygia guttata TaxID=59729 RepID=A0A674HNU2_TAEGU